MKQIEVVAAIIRDEEGCVFATQREVAASGCRGGGDNIECPVTTFVQNT